MKKFSIFILAATFFASCNNNPSSNSQETITATDSNSATQNTATKINASSNCYAHISPADTVLLVLNVDNGKVTGNLIYKLSGKDSNRGSFTGTMSGDTLVADYTYMSEGIESVKQVAFLFEDTIAMPGYGNMVENDGKIIFQNPSDLSFDRAFVLLQSACN